MKILEANIYLFIATIIVVGIGIYLYVKKTGFHTKNQILVTCLLYLGILILSYFLSLPGLICAIALTLFHLIRYRQSQAKIAIETIDWIPSQKFEENYEETKPDESGCYVMLSFPLPVTDGNYKNYETAYVGSSTHVNKEVHKVINNKTLSRVYEDIKNGKYIYISIHPVAMDEINQLQEKLIAKYNAVPYLLSFKEVREKQKVKA